MPTGRLFRGDCWRINRLIAGGVTDIVGYRELPDLKTPIGHPACNLVSLFGEEIDFVLSARFRRVTTSRNAYPRRCIRSVRRKTALSAGSSPTGDVKGICRTLVRTKGQAGEEQRACRIGAGVSGYCPSWPLRFLMISITATRTPAPIKP
jgi:hypothetical protein